MSPRVEKTAGARNVDLGKPTFRMGYIKVPVIDKYKEIAITTKTDKDVYRPRRHRAFVDQQPFRAIRKGSRWN